MSKHSITFVVGPTASGKSSWALKEAQKNNGIILNADSVQIYKFLDIGAAKPTPVDRAIVRHELYDLVTPDQEFTAGDYRRRALEVIEKNIDGNNLFIVGGSGFYIQALERGMFDVGSVDPAVKAELNGKSAVELWQQLKLVDSKSADKLNVNDEYRVRRALEITLSEKRPWSQISDEFRDKPSELAQRYNIRKIGISIEREALRNRVVARTEQMLSLGFIDEVKRLLEMGYGESRVLGSVGYAECFEVLKGHAQLEDLHEAIITSTMQLAKKQTTWFKRDPEIEWIQP